MPRTTAGERQKTQSYSPADLELFAEYREVRAYHRPLSCTRSGRCWVDIGPPAYISRGHNYSGTCEECGGQPR